MYTSFPFHSFLNDHVPSNVGTAKLATVSIRAFPWPFSFQATGNWFTAQPSESTVHFSSVFEQLSMFEKTPSPSRSAHPNELT